MNHLSFGVRTRNVLTCGMIGFWLLCLSAILGVQATFVTVCVVLLALFAQALWFAMRIDFACKTRKPDRTMTCPQCGGIDTRVSGGVLGWQRILCSCDVCGNFWFEDAKQEVTK